MSLDRKSLLKDPEGRRTSLNGANGYLLERIRECGVEILRDWKEIRPGVLERVLRVKDGSTAKIRQTSYFCQDCLEEYRLEQDFVVSNELWDLVCNSGMICRSCFEQRLGRPLVFEDFKKGVGLHTFIQSWIEP